MCQSSTLVGLIFVINPVTGILQYKHDVDINTIANHFALHVFGKNFNQY